MKLYSLYFAKKKTGKQKLLMTDSYAKCEAYKKAREATKGSDAGNGHHEIREAEEDQKTYRRQSTNRKSGWIGKNGFNPHT